MHMWFIVHMDEWQEIYYLQWGRTKIWVRFAWNNKIRAHMMVIFIIIDRPFFWTRESSTFAASTLENVHDLQSVSFIPHPQCAAAAAKSLQLCPTLCDPIDSSPPGSPVPGILQARTPEWVAVSFSKAWKWKVEVKSLSCVPLFMTPWTAAYQAPPTMGFPRQEYWSGVPLPSPTPTV